MVTCAKIKKAYEKENRQMVFVKTEDGIDICVLPDSARCTLANENPLLIPDLPEDCPERKMSWDCVCKPSYCEHYEE